MSKKGMSGKVKIFIGIGVVLVLALIIPFLVFMIRSNGEMGKMSPLQSGEITTGIYAINTGPVNYYLVHSNGEYIAIDAGANLEQAKYDMNNLQIDPDKVTTVLLTHTDSDHTAAVKLFKNAKVYISNEEEKMIDGKTRRQFIIKNKLDAEYETLEDGHRMNVSNAEIECILTPGHTYGSMSYIINDKYLFVGDIISLKDGKAELFNSFFNMDEDIQSKSIKKISNLENVEYIFTGHYGYSDKYQNVFNN